MRRAARPRVRALAFATLLLVTLGVRASSVAAEVVPEGAEVTQSYREAMPPKLVPKAWKAAQNASLSPQQCRSELKRRKLEVKRWGGAAVGVATPVRIEGPIGGVRFVAPGGKSPYGILDCRLVLELEELAQVLVKHGVREVRVDNMYRPKARLPGRKKPSQHSYGLAIDMTRFVLADGRELVVERDFQGVIGEQVCGEDAKEPSELGKEAVELRDLICEVARRGLFHHILTPNHDAAHRDHFHLDIARGARTWMIE
jgi:hypothetical protein